MKIFGVIILGFSSLFMSCDSVNYDDLESLKAERNQVLSDKKEIKSNKTLHFISDNAAPVGILPTPNRVQCGRKGFDSGKEGQAEFSEWPWHVGLTE